MTLPLFIRKENRWLMAVLCGIAFLIGYSVPNHFHFFEPRYLTLTAWDRAIPFLPWTIFIYQSEYFLFVIAYFAFDREENRNKYVWAYLGVLVFAMLIFIFFPTTYPRASYPLPEDLNPVVHSAFTVLRTLDDPSNCFPSLHVACCYLTAFGFLSRGESKTKLGIFMVWATLVALSTLPTKQHYIVDVVAGLALSWAGYWIFFKKVRYAWPKSLFRKGLDAPAG